MSQTFPATRYCSPAEAAARYGLAVVTIRRRIADGSLPAFKFGPRPVGKLKDVRPIRIPIDALDALLEPVNGGAA